MLHAGWVKTPFASLPRLADTSSVAMWSRPSFSTKVGATPSGSTALFAGRSKRGDTDAEAGPGRLHAQIATAASARLAITSCVSRLRAITGDIDPGRLTRYWKYAAVVHEQGSQGSPCAADGLLG